MPLGRFGVRNEYGLGGTELYKDTVESEDPKAVLDGLAVAGVVGLLRQIGDLSQFAAEIFHGLQEQVASISSRSRKLVTRVENIEASLPSLEKAILSQTSHVHFAYTPGSGWHPRITYQQNHLICNDLPHFFMDSYEECREPPLLQLLDRFDPSGTGSCLKRYTDPTFFRKASFSSEARNRDKSQRERKARKIKRKRSLQRSGHLPNSVPNTNNSRRTPVSSETGQEESSLSYTGSTFDRTSRSDPGHQSGSLNLKEIPSHVESLSQPCISTQPDKTKNKEFLCSMDENMVDIRQKNHINDKTGFNGYDIQSGSSTETSVPDSSNVTWDEKLEILEHSVHLTSETFSQRQQDLKSVSVKSINQVKDLSEHGSIRKFNNDQEYTDNIFNVKLKESTELHFPYKQDVKPIYVNNSHGVDLCEVACSPESNTDGNCGRTVIDTKFTESSELSYLHDQEMKSVNAESSSQEECLTEQSSSSKSNDNGNHPTEILDFDMELTERDSGIDQIQDLDEVTFDFREHDIVQENPEPSPPLPSLPQGENSSHEHNLVIANPESFQVSSFDKGVNSFELTSNSDLVSDTLDKKLSTRDIQYVLETSDDNNLAIESVVSNHASVSFPPVANLSSGENTLGLITSENFSSGQSNIKLGIEDVQNMPQENFAEANVNVIEWHHHEDIDSETDNFVDALNTIDSESESDFETYTKKVESSTSVCNPTENESTVSESESDFGICTKKEVESSPSVSSPTKKESIDLVTDETIHSIMDYHGCHSRSYDQVDGDYDGSEKPTSLSIAQSDCLEDEQLSQYSEVGTYQEQSSQQSEVAKPDCLENEHPSFSSKNQCMDVCVNANEMKLQPAICKPVQSSSLTSRDDVTVCTPHGSGEMPFGSTSSYPYAFWTNGTLLGLQPSKPTVVSMSNSVDSAMTSSGFGDQCSRKVDGLAGTMLSSVENYGNDDSQNLGSLKYISHDVSDMKYNESLDVDGSDRKNDPVTPGLGNGHVGPDLKNIFPEVTEISEDGASLLSLLGRNLLKSGLCRNGSLGYGHNGKSFDVSDVVPQSNLNRKLGIPVNSPPTSPPLEHMKISFRPIDGFETSKLKLKYSEGIDNHEMTVENFPSFQLVPESSTLHHDMGSDSDSDEDTFCRSYPCVSDDSASNRSDSDSEQWETGDSSDNNDHAFYNGLGRISTESGSSPSQLDETDGGSMPVCSKSDPISQLPFFNTKNKFGYAEMKMCLNPEAGMNQSFNSPLLESSNSLRGADDLAKLQSRKQESDTTVKQKKLADLKVDDLEQRDHEANGRTVDDQGDFLHQIRTKASSYSGNIPSI